MSNSATKLPSPEQLARELARRRRNALNIPELKARQTALEDALNAQTIVLEAFKAQQALMDQVAELPFDELRSTLAQISQESGDRASQTMNTLSDMLVEARTQSGNLEQQIARLQDMVDRLPTVIPEPVATDLRPIAEELSTIQRNMLTEIPNQEIQIGPLSIEIVDRDEEGNINEVKIA